MRSRLPLSFFLSALIANIPLNSATPKYDILSSKDLLLTPIHVQAQQTTFTTKDDSSGPYLDRHMVIGKKYSFPASARADEGTDNLKNFKPVVVDGYVFVPDSCGGGNAWKCDGYEAFKAKDGKPLYLGYLSVAEEGGQLPYEGGYFFDIFDKLEDTCTCHGCAPYFMLGLKERDDSLSLDPVLTKWINAEITRRKLEAFKKISSDMRERKDAALHLAAFYKVIGDKRSLEELRAELRSDPAFKTENFCGKPVIEGIDHEIDRIKINEIVEKRLH